MTDDKEFKLSRRKALGALGTIGVASAGAGLGTSAYFSDEETFKDNSLTAGSLDLKVAWEEHYSDWSEDEMVMVDDGDGGTMEGIRMDPPSNSGSWIAMPDPQNPLLYVHADAIDQFMANTAVEAYPDDGDNGSQSLHRYSPDNYCTTLADTPDDLDPSNSDPARTNGPDTVDEDGNVKPLVSIDDVKPGDFGELTFNFQLCDNPGYVWMNGQLVSASENGTTEPEADDPDEKPGTVELLDEIQTALWYDDGDNVLETGEVGSELDIVLTLDESGSISDTELNQIRDAAKTFVDQLGASDQSAAVAFAAQATVKQSLTTDKQAVKNAIDGAQMGGTTNMQAAISTAQGELASNGRSSADPIIILLGDGAPTTRTSDPSDTPIDLTNDNVEAALEAADAAKSAGTRILSLGFGIGTTGENVLKSIAGTSANSESTYQSSTYDDEGDYFAAPSSSDLQSAFDSIKETIVVDEEVFFRGSLRETLNLLSGKATNGNTPNYDAPGIPLDADLDSNYPEVIGTPRRPSPGADDRRQCFDPNTLHSVGLTWYLPVDHANEIQTDSVQFDVGFYTEQCRHNDGAGMDSGLTPTRTGSGWAKQERNFNGDGTESSFARGRYGDNTDAGAWEIAVGNDLGSADTGNYVWTSGKTVDWSYNYDPNTSTATFTLDGQTVSKQLSEAPDGRVAIQTKADEATVAATVDSMSVGGSTVHFSGPTSVEASNDGDGRDLQYLVINVDVDGGVTMSGTATVTLQGDFPGGDEDAAFDVVLE
jgi:predicted ribosomally synthesized peptide with SipW-like signal peptide